MIKPLRLYALDIVADNPSAFSPSIEAAERRECNRSWHAKSQRQEQEAAISLEIATPDLPALSNVSILFMKPRTSGRKIACPNQESCLLSCLARVGFFQAITPHKSQPLKNLINPLQLFFPTPYILALNRETSWWQSPLSSPAVVIVLHQYLRWQNNGVWHAMVFVPLSGMGHRPFPRVLRMTTAPYAISTPRTAPKTKSSSRYSTVKTKTVHPKLPRVPTQEKCQPTSTLAPQRLSTCDHLAQAHNTRPASWKHHQQLLLSLIVALVPRSITQFSRNIIN